MEQRTMAVVYTIMCVKAHTDEIYTGQIKKPGPFPQEKKKSTIAVLS